MPNGRTSTSRMAFAFDPPRLGLIEVHGTEAGKVLNGLCTAKLADLAIGTSTETFFTDDRGRVLAHVMVARDTTSHWIVGQIAETAALVAHIDRFIFREDATPRNQTPGFRGVLVTGAPQSLSQFSGLPTEMFGQFGWHSVNIEDIQTRWLRWPMLERSDAVDLQLAPQTSWLCVVPRDQADELEQRLVKASCESMSLDELETARIAAFWPQTGPEINERTLPQELDRDSQAISFTKGCYLGQETVARLDAMGEVQKKLCLVAFDGSNELEPGSSLTRDGKEVGKITSVAPMAIGGKRQALAYMRRGNFAVDTTFEVATSAGIIQGRVVTHAAPSLGTTTG